MSNRVDYAQRRGLDVSCDDLRDMYWGWYPKEVKSLVAADIRKLAENRGFRFEIYWQPKEQRYVIFGANDRGFRWHFLNVRELNSDVVIGISREMWRFQAMSNLQQVRERNRQRKIKEQKAVEGEMDNIRQQAREHRRTVQTLGRYLGIDSGKVRIPFARPPSYRAERRDWNLLPEKEVGGE